MNDGWIIEGNMATYYSSCVHGIEWPLKVKPHELYWKFCMHTVYLIIYIIFIYSFDMKRDILVMDKFIYVQFHISWQGRSRSVFFLYLFQSSKPANNHSETQRKPSSYWLYQLVWYIKEHHIKSIIYFKLATAFPSVSKTRAEQSCKVATYGTVSREIRPKFDVLNVSAPALQFRNCKTKTRFSSRINA